MPIFNTKWNEYNSFYSWDLSKVYGYWTPGITYFHVLSQLIVICCSGGGTEIPSHYPQWRVEYAKLDSPLLLQASLTKLLDGEWLALLFPLSDIPPHTACGDPSLSHSSSWFGRLESSGWLEHVSKLMSAAKAVSLAIHNDGEP